MPTDPEDRSGTPPTPGDIPVESVLEAVPSGMIVIVRDQIARDDA